MAGDGGALKDFNEIKCQFRTREGFYKLLTLSDSQQRGGGPRGQAVATGVATGSGAGSIPGAGGGGGGGGGAPGPGAGSGPASVSSASATASVAPGSSSSSTSSPAGFLPPVRVSMVKLQPESPGEESERVCFNIGRELYFYTYTNIKKAVDLSKPIDKRIYKGTQPTCHDFNQFSATADSVSLIVGFSAGQVQYLDPIKKETSKLFNEERLIDKTKVTCLKWLPESEQLFLASHASGNLYLYNVEHPCGSTAPQYSLLRQGDGFTVYTCKSKTPRNPLLRWSIGEGGLNEFAFSPDGTHLACVGQDGCLRVFHFDSMELQGVMKSYFGGLLCVSWSPDGKYLATGGEDDLVTVWSFAEGRVIARGHGHKSWVNVVAFDPYTTNLEDDDQMGFSGSEEDLQDPIHFGRVRTSSTLSRLSKHSSKAGSSVTYRFGSVGQDTQFCLWDLTEDILYPHLPLSRARTLTNTFSSTIPPSVSGGSNLCSLGTSTTADGSVGHHPQHGHHHPVTHGPPLPRSLSRSNSLPHPAVTNASKGQTASEGNAPFSIGRFATLSLQERKSDKSSGGSAEKEHKRYHSLGNISKSNDKINVAPRSSRLDAAKVLGTTLCPRMNEVPLLEPLVCKKIAHERLTVLMFLDDCIITACQEGLICTWARPGKTTLTTQNGSSPSGTVV
ncbi:WD repeat-containing protein 20 [Erpetoichthys calabaricus]|uniref:WD repeat-containing protein 20 n=1 Tax=Erpetoichthys calabaricus TaxID=27687 RepID=UPI00109F9336|nr:WD repeat-containing protein 20 [Erpetoichthys calabaricus]